MRYKNESKEKRNGVIYTPTDMADYLAAEMIKYGQFDLSTASEVNVLDPAIGEGCKIYKRSVRNNSTRYV